MIADFACIDSERSLEQRKEPWVGPDMEINRAYCDIVAKRWQDFAGEVATLESDGRPFDQVGEARKVAAA
jgi:hypothetical protein